MQFIINLATQSIAFLLSIGVNFFLAPFMVKKVGLEVYGFVGLANDFIGYIQIITIALNSMAARFIMIEMYKKNIKKANEYFSSLIFANTVACICIGIIAFFFILNMEKFLIIPLNHLFDIKILWFCTLINFVISIMTSAYGMTMFMKNRLDISAKISIKSNLIRIFILMVSYSIFNAHVWYIGFSMICCTIFTSFKNMKYTKTLIPNIYFSVKNINFIDIKTLIKSGMWNSINKLSSILATGSDLLITNMFLGSNAMGLMAVSKIIINVILSAFAMISSVFAPLLTIAYVKNNLEETKKQVTYSIKILGIIASVPIVFIFIFSDKFFLLWIPEADAEMLRLLTIFASFSFVIALPLENFWNVFMVTNHIKMPAVFLLVNGILSTCIVFFIIQYLTNDIEKLLLIAGTSTFFSFLRALIFLPMYGAKCIGLKLTAFYPVIMKNLISIGVLSIVAFAVKSNFKIMSWSELVFIMIIISCIALVSNFFIVLNYNERSYLKNKIKFLKR